MSKTIKKKTAARSDTKPNNKFKGKTKTPKSSLKGRPKNKKKSPASPRQSSPQKSSKRPGRVGEDIGVSKTGREVSKTGMDGSKTGALPNKAPYKAFGHWLYGRHCVAAALDNPDRVVLKLCATKQGAQWLLKQGYRDSLVQFQAEEYQNEELDAMLSFNSHHGGSNQGVIHQGVAAQVELLPSLSLEDIVDEGQYKGPIVVLDQLTDPQNIGAIFRSAAAFGVRAIVMQERHTPALTGALAKAAAGTVEIVPCIREVNIARTLTFLQKNGFFCYGLDGRGSEPLAKAPLNGNVALVMGAEGAGLRPLVAKTCDMLVHIPMSEAVESLNVSAAAAITLFAIQQASNL